VAILAGAAVFPAAAQAQAGLPQEEKKEKRAVQGPAPPPMQNDVKVFLRVFRDEPNEIPYTRQERPFDFQNEGSRFQFDSETFWGFPQHEPEGTILLNFSLRASPLRFTVGSGASIVSNSSRIDPGTYGQTTTTPVQPTETGGDLPPPPPPQPTKPSWLGGSDSANEDSDSPLLAGPELEAVLFQDVTGWRPASWLPEGTSLCLYARFLAGEMELFGEDADLTMWSFGPRLKVPFLRAGALDLQASLFAGPAFVDTDLGDAVGFNGGAGAWAELKLTGSIALVLAAEAELFAADDTSAFGPPFNFGLNVGF
jgi:hypothetical protein